MGLQGTIKTSCSKGCEEDEYRVWSFVRGDSDSALREALLAGELNLLICHDCGRMFFPEVSVVYFDPSREMLLFIFPESFKSDAARWKNKMHEDFKRMQEVLGTKGSSGLEPEICFGIERGRERLQAESDLNDEAEIAEFLAEELELSIYPVRRAYALKRNLPRLIPCRGQKQKAFSRSAAAAGIKSLLSANNRLSSFRRWLDVLKKEKSAPPRGAPRKRRARGKR